MIIKRLIFDIICSSVPSYHTAKEFLDIIRHKFKESDKVEIANLVSNFTDAKYDSIGGGGGWGNDYIFYFAQIATRLKVLNVSVADGFRCTIALILYLWVLSS